MLTAFLKINENLKELAKQAVENTPSSIPKHTKVIYLETISIYERYTIVLDNLRLDLELANLPEKVIIEEINTLKKSLSGARQELIAFSNVVWHSKLPNNLKLFCGSSMLLCLNSPDSVEYVINGNERNPAELWQLLAYFEKADSEFRQALIQGIDVRRTELNDELHALKEYYIRLQDTSFQKISDNKEKSANPIQPTNKHIPTS